MENATANTEVKIPTHVGIIMDGNGRWAKLRGKNRSFGHKEGSKNVDKIVSHAFSRGVKVLSLYAFSSENWQRPKEEVDELMRLLSVYFKKFLKKLIKSKVKLTVMGDLEMLSPELKQVILNATEKSKDFTDFVLNIGINYGGRQEIVNAVNLALKDNREITVDAIAENLYTKNLPDPDLIIRTGGEMRISNFMLFQSAYSELYFTDVLWPDFNEEDFDKALENFSHRKRRFGKVL